MRLLLPHPLLNLLGDELKEQFGVFFVEFSGKFDVVAGVGKNDTFAPNNEVGILKKLFEAVEFGFVHPNFLDVFKEIFFGFAVAKNRAFQYKSLVVFMSSLPFTCHSTALPMRTKK